jgi:hypothetical protein
MTRIETTTEMLVEIPANMNKSTMEASLVATALGRTILNAKESMPCMGLEYVSESHEIKIDRELNEIKIIAHFNFIKRPQEPNDIGDLVKDFIEVLRAMEREDKEKK